MSFDSRALSINTHVQFHTNADDNGNGILAIGSQNGSKKIVKLALRYGADINARNSTGNTALHFCYK